VERELLATFINSREAFDDIAAIQGYNHAFSDVGRVILGAVEDYYATDLSVANVDNATLLARLENSVSSPKSFQLIKDVVERLPTVSVPNVREVFMAQRKRMVGAELSTALLTGKDDKSRELMGQWSELDGGLLDEGTDVDVITHENVLEVLQRTRRENLLKLYPPTLNEYAGGGVARGDHILISGRVENGKSLCSINLACGFARDGYKVVYIGNEDSPDRMLPRFISRFSGLVKGAIEKDYEGSILRARAMGFDNIIFVPLPSESPVASIEAILKKHKPDVFVVDQIRNMDTGDKEQRGQLAKAAKIMRRLAQQHNAVAISVTQSLNNAEHINKLVGDMSDIADSKHDLPGQADMIILIGTNEEYRGKNWAMLSIPKNKLTGKHGYFPVQMVPTISAMKDL
jgi:KaiC/GvpD/RAD55 family RecA-like ATPase